jgi:Tfp pilus assembly protein PilN
MITINLLASERRRKPGIVAGGNGPWVVAAVVLAGVLVAWSIALAHRTAQLQAQMTDIARQEAALRPVALQVQQLQQTAAALQGRQAALRQLVTLQMPAAESLQTIQAVIPSDVWLTTMAATNTNQVTFDGYAFSYPEVARFMVQLGGSTSFQNVDLTSSEKDSIGGRDVVKFEVTGTLGARPITSQRGVAR